MSSAPVLSVRGLRVAFQTGGRPVEILHGVDLDIAPGETVGVVGESGSGKTTLAFGVMGHLARNGRVTAGQILFHGEDLLQKREAELQRLRGAQLAMVYQDPHTSLNPSLRIGDQVAEILQVHEHLAPRAAWQRALELLGRVHLPSPEQTARRYPHQISGGQRQRILIAMALACNPSLLIMDEPTTALDVTTEAHILDLVAELKHSFSSAILYITHNLGVIARVADRVAVMYAGQVVEDASVRAIFHDSRHPYTVGLRASLPRVDMGKHDGALAEIPGRIPSPDSLPPGCLFEPRCMYAQPECRAGEPPMFAAAADHHVRCLFWDRVQSELNLPPPTALTGSPHSRTDLLDVQALVKHYRLPGRLPLSPGQTIHAVDGISLRVTPGETLAVVGESGSGKTTLARTIVGLQAPTSGGVRLLGASVAGLVGRRSDASRRLLQMVFQNPDSSLNPRQSILQIVSRPLRRFNKVKGGAQVRAQAAALLRAVNLDESYLDRFPEQLSGGEKQRVAVVRAFAGEPAIVLCDEPVSALDVSVQAAVLNLLLRLQQQHGAGYLLISHDLGVVRYLADRVIVMYAGRVAEQGTVEQVFAPPYHPYTEALLSAIPVGDPDLEQPAIRLDGAPSAAAPTAGCQFALRCPRKVGSICDTDSPPILEPVPGHTIACHIPLDELRRIAAVGPRHQRHLEAGRSAANYSI